MDLYLEHRTQAIRIARGIVFADAEDVVHDVVLYLLQKREYLKAPPGKSYFLKAVRHMALRRLVYAWARLTVAMDPEDLVVPESMAARRALTQGDLLPEPAACVRLALQSGA